VLAPLADFGTASDGIPCHFCPFDTRSRCHGFQP
jgi:hypothetical protein